MQVTQSKIIQEDIKNIAETIREISHELAGKTVLISGGAGFLGRYIVYTLDYLNKNILEKPCKIIVLDNFISGIAEGLKYVDNLVLFKQDISKSFNVDGNIDYIFHAASIASPVFYHKFRLETIDVGILGTRNMLELAKQKNVKSFLFFSSSEIYGNPDPKFIPTNEEYLGNVSCIGPRACYDEPKRMGETLCMNYAEIYNLPIKIIRPFNIYGPGMRFDDGRVVPNFVVSALKGEKMPIYGNGYNTRTFCYVSDAIVGFFQVILSTHNREVFNIGADDPEIQMRHLADIVLGLVENDFSKVHYMEGPTSVYGGADPNRRCPDLTKIRTLVGYRPSISLVSGLKRFISWAEEELELQGITYNLEKNCRICENTELKKVISLGKSPLANNLLSEQDIDKEELFPLDLMYCPNCHLCQLSYVVPPEKMFKHYVYVTSTTDTFKKHFGDMADHLFRTFNLGNNSLAVDIGSNDGLLLKNFKQLGLNVIGIEPAGNIANLAMQNGVYTINDFFNDKVVREVVRLKGKADIITANNVFAHVGNIKELTANVKDLLKDDGIFCIEVQYLFDTLRKMTFDNIYHEHLSYFTVLSLNEFFKRQSMQIFRVEHVDTHGGSIRVFIQKDTGKNALDVSVLSAIEIERSYGLDRFETYEAFAQKVYGVRDKVQSFIKEIKRDGKRIVGYGAPAKATTLLNFCGINSQHIESIVEDNSLKHGLIVPGVRIPIVSRQKLDENPPHYIIILAWNFTDEILKKNEYHYRNGTKFIVPLPEPRIV